MPEHNRFNLTMKNPQTPRSHKFSSHMVKMADTRSCMALLDELVPLKQFIAPTKASRNGDLKAINSAVLSAA